MKIALTVFLLYATLVDVREDYDGETICVYETPAGALYYKHVGYGRSCPTRLKVSDDEEE